MDSEKKESVIEKEEMLTGAKMAEKDLMKGPDHCHVLMSPEYTLNLLEISHHTIEKIEKQRFKVMAKFEGDEAVTEFKNFVFNKLTE